MGAKIRKTPQQAVQNWGTGVTNGGNNWASGYLAAAPEVFNANNVDPQAWQNGVSDPNAAARYLKGMTSVNMSQLTTTVNGAGKGKYTASGTAKQAKMTNFMTSFIPKLDNILVNLDNTNPRASRGSASNRARLNAYLDAVQSTRGTY